MKYIVIRKKFENRFFISVSNQDGKCH